MKNHLKKLGQTISTLKKTIAKNQEEKDFKNSPFLKELEEHWDDSFPLSKISPASYAMRPCSTIGGFISRSQDDISFEEWVTSRDASSDPKEVIFRNIETKKSGYSLFAKIADILRNKMPIFANALENYYSKEKYEKRKEFHRMNNERNKDIELYRKKHKEVENHRQQIEGNLKDILNEEILLEIQAFVSEKLSLPESKKDSRLIGLSGKYDFSEP